MKWTLRLFNRELYIDNIADENSFKIQNILKR